MWVLPGRMAAGICTYSPWTLECATNAGGRLEVAGVIDRGAVRKMKD